AQPLVDIGVDLPRAQTRDAIEAREGPRGLSIDTGVARIDVALDRPEPVTLRVAADAREIPIQLTLDDASGTTAALKLVRAEIGERGPLRVVVKLTGHAGAGASALDVIVRLHTFVGLGAVRADVTLRNPRRAQHVGGHWDLGDAGSVLIRR